jgi:hypothetical protein
MTKAALMLLQCILRKHSHVSILTAAKHSSFHLICDLRTHVSIFPLISNYGVTSMTILINVSEGE